MEDLINQIEVAKKNGLFMLCLYSVLNLPDIAGAIDSENGRASGEKYRKWFKKFVKPKLSVYLNADECYQYRCKVLHQGQSEPNEESYYSKIGFLIPNPKMKLNIGRMKLGDDKGPKIIALNDFTDAIINGWKEWIKIRQGTEPFKTNYNKCLKNYPNGKFGNFIVGMPIIA